MQRVRHANRGRLLLRTPGPVPFGICKCSLVETTDIQYDTPVYDTFPWFDFLPTLTLLLNKGFQRAFATGMACRQGALTPPDTWSCPTLGLACVPMSRPISPELVLSPDFWISNIPRYFSFAYERPTFPLTAKVVQSIVHGTLEILFKIQTEFHKDGYILKDNQELNETLLYNLTLSKYLDLEISSKCRYWNYSTDQLIVKLLLSFCYLFAIFLTAFAIYDRNLFVFKRARNLKLANFRNLTKDI